MTIKTCATCKHWKKDDRYTGVCQVTMQRRGNENTCKEWKKNEETDQNQG